MGARMSRLFYRLATSPKNQEARVARGPEAGGLRRWGGTGPQYWSQRGNLGGAAARDGPTTESELGEDEDRSWMAAKIARRDRGAGRG
jgi:hypothetical protein